MFGGAMASLGQILVWWLLSVVLGVISLPTATKVFRFLPDKGIGLARVLGLLLTSYVAWILGFAVNSTATCLIAWGMLAACSYWIYSKNSSELKALLFEQAGLLLVYEALFLFLFVLWAFVRMYNPDVLNTEKFMDFAFFNALTRARHFPPFDPWLAAPKNYLNYYYFGYFSFASYARLTFLEPAVCYNLVIAFVFALSGQAVFSIGYNTTKAWWPSFAGVAVLQFFGNLHGGLQVLANKSLDIDWWAPTRLIKDVSKATGGYVNSWWWSASPEALAANHLDASAAKEGLISEFPNFSFLHGDMHPHFTAIPFVLLALALGLNLLKNEDRDPLNVLEGGATRLSRVLSLGTLALALGVIFMANTWDLPAYGLVLSVVLLAQQHFLGRLDRQHWLRSWLLPSGLLLAGLLVASTLFLVFFINPAKDGVGRALAKTGLHDTLVFWGGFLVVLLPFVALRVRLWGKSLLGEWATAPAVARPGKAASVQAAARLCVKCGARLRPGKPFCAQCGHKNDPEATSLQNGPVEAFEIRSTGTPALVADLLKLFCRPAFALRNTTVKVVALVLGVLWVFLLVWAPTTWIFVTLALLSALLLASRQDRPEALFAISLIAVGSMLVSGVEWFYLKDVFKDNPSLTRMNTIFKFYFQAWILFSVSLPFAIQWTLRAFSQIGGEIARNCYLALLGIVFFLAALYPLGAFKSVASNFLRDANFSPTLDGSAWLKRDYPGDADMILWLRANVEGKAVIAEAVGPAYSRFARVASYTGLAAVVGWGNHESQWRQKWPTEAEQDVNRLFETMDVNEARTLIGKYGVQYVFCGALERSKYSPDQLNKFRSFMEVARDNGQGTVVFKTRG
jgi:uncharacterized membrane protein